jgi:hypothetical protein
LRERGNTALKRSAETAPNVLHFDFELLATAAPCRTVSYALVASPPAGTASIR